METDIPWCCTGRRVGCQGHPGRDLERADAQEDGEKVLQRELPDFEGQSGRH